MKLFDSTLQNLERALDVRLERQNAFAADIANVDTPGYRPTGGSFEQALQRSAAQTLAPLPPPQAAEPGSGAALRAPSAPLTAAVPSGGTAGETGLDGNAVDLDRTMVAMAENALQYGASARAASRKLAMLRYAASDGNA